ncbi:MAG: CoA protein activase [Firmicutes bacterium]|nr:CoA protein activase [Bacillota bacterium]
MRVTTPHMGKLDRIFLDLFARTGIEYIAPPKTSARTLQLGVRYSPEFACLPLKVTIGNFIEALESGADTLLMAGGVGPCRFGYYAEIQKCVLEEAGYKFNMIVLEPPAAGWKLFIDTVKILAPGKSIYQIWQIIKVSFRKARIMDELEKYVLKYRAYEVNRGDTTKAYKKALDIIQPAMTNEEITQAAEEAFLILESVEKDMDRPVLKVGIVGEFFVLLEPFTNFDIEEYLGNMGVSLERSVYLTDWISPSSKNPVMGISDSEIAKAAKPYLNHFVGGEGLPSVGHTIIYAKEGLDGVIQLFPFTCMPDTIAKSILPQVSRDFDIPIISFVIDEQTGRAGIITRLEAFIDLLASRKKHKDRLQALGHGAHRRELARSGAAL